MSEYSLKSILLGFLLSALVGGGIYGFYVKTMSTTVLTQSETYGLVMECVQLSSSIDSNKINSFFRKVSGMQKKIDETDSVIMSVGIISGQKIGDAHGMGKTLSMCINDLRLHLNELQK